MWRQTLEFGTDHEFSLRLPTDRLVCDRLTPVPRRGALVPAHLLHPRPRLGPPAIALSLPVRHAGPD